MLDRPLIERRAGGTLSAMRQLVMQMMTTLNGRLDHPEEWVPEIPGDLYAEIDRIYESFDTVLVGRATALEMAEYWPGAETDESEPAVARSMARKMNAYKKYVFTRSSEPLEWSNVELVSPDGDEAVVAFVEELKARPGGDVHLSGGAQLARTLIRLGLVDRYRLFVYPVVSAGARWFDEIGEQRGLELESATAYSNGVVGLYYI
jgi:dihydrofolate reductase